VWFSLSDREQMTDGQAEMPDSAATHNSAAAPDLTAKKPAKKESWGEVVKTIVYALLIAGVIRSLFFQPFNIPSASMEATLLEGDYLFVSKFSYGYSRHSFPFGIVPFAGRVFSGDPERGDVVVFKYPPDDSTDYIKRLIGLPGDRIEMQFGTLHLNGEPIPKVETEPYVEFFGSVPHNVSQYIETFPDGTNYMILDRQPNGNLDNTEVFVVPEGHYFMMGDNRDNSADSRADVGFVPHENLVGKAQVIFFSTDGSARLWEVWKWPFAIRYERIFKSVR
jgi:signal peptidase I